jgi:hypothetical protein
MEPTYRLTEDGIARVSDGKLVATIEEGEIKPTAPTFHRLKAELKKFMAHPASEQQEQKVSRKGEPPMSFLGDRTPEVLAWRRENWTAEQFFDAYGLRFSYREGGEE